MSCKPALLGIPAGRVAGEIRQAGEIVFAERQHVGLLVREHILAEAGAKACEPVPDLLQPVLGGSSEPRAGTAEERMIALQHPRLLGAKAKGARPPVQRIDSGEQRLVEVNLVPVPGKL